MSMEKCVSKKEYSPYGKYGVYDYIDEHIKKDSSSLFEENSSYTHKQWKGKQQSKEEGHSFYNYK